MKNEQAELEYQKQRKLILLQTLMVCTELINLNALKSELLKRIAYAVQIANAYRSKYDIGEANILDYNKARINLLNITKEKEANEIERNALLFELARLNGGAGIIFNDSMYAQQTIVSDFEQWYTQAEQKNPVFTMAQAGNNDKSKAKTIKQCFEPSQVRCRIYERKCCRRAVSGNCSRCFYSPVGKQKQLQVRQSQKYSC